MIIDEAGAVAQVVREGRQGGGSALALLTKGCGEEEETRNGEGEEEGEEE